MFGSSYTRGVRWVDFWANKFMITLIILVIYLIGAVLTYSIYLGGCSTISDLTAADYVMSVLAGMLSWIYLPIIVVLSLIITGRITHRLW